MKADTTLVGTGTLDFMGTKASANSLPENQHTDQIGRACQLASMVNGKLGLGTPSMFSQVGYIMPFMDV